MGVAVLHAAVPVLRAGRRGARAHGQRARVHGRVAGRLLPVPAQVGAASADACTRAKYQSDCDFYVLICFSFNLRPPQTSSKIPLVSVRRVRRPRPRPAPPVGGRGGRAVTF